MSTPAAVKKKARKSFGYTTVNVDAEVDLDEIIDDLVADGEIHRAEECPAAGVVEANRSTFEGVPDVIASLHRQAHPSAHPSVWMCNEEPCRSLPMDLVIQRIGRGA